MNDTVSYQFSESVAVITLDDGKANALDLAVIEAINNAIDRATADDARAIVINGRAGKFCAGFNLKVMTESQASALEVLNAGGELALRLYELPVSLVLGVTGHALAMGAILLFTADYRIGAQGDFKIGMNEVAIGMALPGMALQLAEDRLGRQYYHRAVSGAEVFSPDGAVAAGFLDSVVDADSVVEAAQAKALEMVNTLNPDSLAETKLRARSLRAAALRRVLSESRGI